MGFETRGTLWERSPFPKGSALRLFVRWERGAGLQCKRGDVGAKWLDYHTLRCSPTPQEPMRALEWNQMWLRMTRFVA